MEEFVMDLLTFVGLKLWESGDKPESDKYLEEMTDEELHEYYMQSGINVAMQETMDFLLKRYQIFCEKENKGAVEIKKAE